MDKDRFKQKMEQLEKEREEFINRLTPEGLQEYNRKKEELNEKFGLNSDNTFSGNNTIRKWTK